MKIAANLEIKKFSEVVPGELVVFGQSSREIGIALHRNADKDCLIGTFVSADEVHPRLLYQDSNSKCLTLGSDWVVEPIHGDEAFPGLHQVGRRSGILALTSSGWVMNFASSSMDRAGRFSTEWWNIELNSQLTQFPNTSAFFLSWRIWQIDSDRADIRTKPIFEYFAVPSPMPT